eukprot:TRINITY_DN10452_c0_g1_i1.p1 TRINITY_DN10452_c0_g1~~TRINITY_DN10452_c0_g1_i1.p1  ORF type:complete len:252 (-),score=58.71 TRINITY_DN10452_c0_g1_i1:40-795(-)
MNMEGILYATPAAKSFSKSEEDKIKEEDKESKTGIEKTIFKEEKKTKIAIPREKKIKKIGKDEPKIKIDTLQDLNKLSFTQIKNLSISQLEGKLFEEAFHEAVYGKAGGKKIGYNIASIEFNVCMKVEFGYSIYLIGGCEFLGNWNPNGAYKMLWSEGHIWKSWLKKSQLPLAFHYKYAVVETTTQNAKRWEGGNNRYFCFYPIEEHLESPHLSYIIHATPVHKFTIGTTQMEYIREKEHLIICDNWQPSL